METINRYAPSLNSGIFILSSTSQIHNDSKLTRSRLFIFIQYFVYSFYRIPRYKSRITRVVLRSLCHFSQRSTISRNIKMSNFSWKIRAKLFDTGQTVESSWTYSDRENIKVYGVRILSETLRLNNMIITRTIERSIFTNIKLVPQKCKRKVLWENRKYQSNNRKFHRGSINFVCSLELFSYFTRNRNVFIRVTQFHVFLSIKISQSNVLVDDRTISSRKRSFSIVPRRWPVVSPNTRATSIPLLKRASIYVHIVRNRPVHCLAPLQIQQRDARWLIPDVCPVNANRANINFPPLKIRTYCFLATCTRACSTAFG